MNKRIKQLVAKKGLAERNKKEIEFEKVLLEERYLAWVRAVLRECLDAFTVVKWVPDRIEVV
ncbi:hypothetical protein AA0112_g4074 [Alternaria arborescens]|nr:hypothetical protein AA0112_g4074 [Alternaria arborescens]